MNCIVTSLARVVVVLTLGIGVLFYSTDGFMAFTSEAARRVAVNSNPRQLPAIIMKDQNNRSWNFNDYQGKVLLVEFIYTNCPDVCNVMGAEFLNLAGILKNANLENKVTRISISFDLQRDGYRELQAYAQRFGSNAENWLISRATQQKDLDVLLDVFGIIVFPDKSGGYEHNAAVHIIDTRGNLVQILDFDQLENITTAIASWL